MSFRFVYDKWNKFAKEVEAAGGRASILVEQFGDERLAYGFIAPGNVPHWRGGYFAYDDPTRLWEWVDAMEEDSLSRLVCVVFDPVAKQERRENAPYDVRVHRSLKRQGKPLPRAWIEKGYR